MNVRRCAAGPRAPLLAMLWLGAITAFPVGAGHCATDDAHFQRGVQLVEAGRYAEALSYFEETLSEHPSNPETLWNLGIVHAEIGNHPQALYYWQMYRLVRPGDWRTMERMIQSYQATGDVAARDAMRREFYLWHSLSVDAEAQRPERFCRERFTLGQHTVRVFEYFEPRDDPQVFYRFSVARQDGTEESVMVLGLSAAENRQMHERGELAGNRQNYYLDYHDRRSQQTVGFFDSQGKPPYDQVREEVMHVLRERFQ